MHPAITLERVSRSFRGFWGRNRVQAVRDLSLEVPSGQIFGILGPNGSGKTTTLLMILGLLRPSSGRIRVLGYAPGDRKVRARIGYLPEEFSPPDLLSGEEVLRFYGGFFPIGRRELGERVERLLEDLDLATARRRRFREYSKGMRRRIGLAQALLHEPELLVLDEPTNGLDPLGVRKVKSIFLELRSRGRTIVISSHVLPELEEVCDRIAVLHQGACVAAGKTEELLIASEEHQIVLERTGGPEAERAAEILRKGGYRVAEVRPGRRSLESLFLEMVGRSGAPEER